MGRRLAIEIRRGRTAPTTTVHILMLVGRDAAMGVVSWANAMDATNHIIKALARNRITPIALHLVLERR
jgi:hypothetical protein